MSLSLVEGAALLMATSESPAAMSTISTVGNTTSVAAGPPLDEAAESPLRVLEPPLAAAEGFVLLFLTIVVLGEATRPPPTATAAAEDCPTSVAAAAAGELPLSTVATNIGTVLSRRGVGRKAGDEVRTGDLDFVLPTLPVLRGRGGTRGRGSGGGHLFVCASRGVELPFISDDGRRSRPSSS